jgi:hypothetical protein
MSLISYYLVVVVNLVEVSLNLIESVIDFVVILSIDISSSSFVSSNLVVGDSGISCFTVTIGLIGSLVDVISLLAESETVDDISVNSADVVSVSAFETVESSESLNGIEIEMFSLFF